MKNKKGLIALSSIVGVCALGLILSTLVDWPVDNNKTSGDIGKSTRFSRKTAVEPVSNMEELLLNDAEYKNGMVSAYVVMQTRAQQFSSLVDMSNEVAGEIPAYENVLDEMNKVYVTVNNVCASLERAGENINATLSGEKRPDLAQNSMNASLAYIALQKQNKLATEFIDVTDKYVQSTQADDRLLFVRDQWVDYQLMTAALEGDQKSAAALEKKGALLEAEKSAATLGAFEASQQLSMINSANLANTLGVESSLSAVASSLNAGFILDNALSSPEIMNSFSAVSESLNAVVAGDALQANTCSYLNSMIDAASLGGRRKIEP